MLEHLEYLDISMYTIGTSAYNDFKILLKAEVPKLMLEHLEYWIFQCIRLAHQHIMALKIC